MDRYSIGSTTLWRWRCAGLPAIKTSKASVRFLVSDIDAWLKEHRQVLNGPAYQQEDKSS